ncbi:uncharacterized protein BYT42DRAFT_280010 [Radiomyces spectabilis]|uniref:uncharacterized protein n=1 Tax=Radiomyces spectabilis TaxID=64574 RepID=UPI002220661F|nr:uncharacterized protein BYT42DRAFT_280010 [Radiomyces spectabilis]KAI8384943.1 hypothetical protein BYT42DRAFT_280010 [Radiomyces spectabilis]
MSGDLDHILRDLEKQVHDFSLTVENPTAIHTQPYPNLASSRVNHSTRQAVDGAHPSSSKFQHSVPRHDTSYSVHDPANIYSSDISSDGEPDPRTQRPAQQHLADDTESSDDDICIADLQRPMKMQMDRMASKKSHLPTTMTDHSGGGLVRSPSVNVRSIKPDIPDEPTPVAPSQDTDDDLRAAMQRAWAVLEAESGVTEELNQKSDTSIKEAEVNL